MVAITSPCEAVEAELGYPCRDTLN